MISPLPPPAGGMATWTQKYLESNKSADIRIFLVNTALTGKRANRIKKRYYFHEVKRARVILSRLNKMLSRNRIDVVHLNCAVGRFGSIVKDYLFALTVKKYKVRLITHFHCDVSDMVDSKTDRFFFRRLVDISDAVLTMNGNSRKFTYSVCGKVSIDMPNFISDEYFDSETFEKKLPDTVGSVLFAGHVKTAKGCDVIYKTAELFPEIRFNLLGHISDEFRKMSKPDNLLLLGEVTGERVKNEMLKADVLLFPTHTEGFPYVVIEAMACGMPIISTPVGAIPDMLENNGGILVPVGDVSAVAEAISALQNKDLREKMACWNRQKARSCYAADKVMDRLFVVYNG